MKKLPVHISEFLKHGKLNKAIKLLIENQEYNGLDEVVIFSSRFKELEKEKMLGVITNDQAQARHNKLTYDILNFFNPENEKLPTFNNHKLKYNRRVNENFGKPDFTTHPTSRITLITSIPAGFLNPFAPEAEDFGFIDSVSFYDDGELLLTHCSKKGVTRIWDLKSRELLQDLDENEFFQIVSDISYYILGVTNNNKINLYDLTDSKDNKIGVRWIKKRSWTINGDEKLEMFCLVINELS